MMMIGGVCSRLKTRLQSNCALSSSPISFPKFSLHLGPIYFTFSDEESSSFGVESGLTARWRQIWANMVNLKQGSIMITATIEVASLKKRNKRGQLIKRGQNAAVYSVRINVAIRWIGEITSLLGTPPKIVKSIKIISKLELDRNRLWSLMERTIFMIRIGVQPWRSQVIFVMFSERKKERKVSFLFIYSRSS